MTSLILKLIAVPIVLLISAFFFPGVHFESFWQIIVVGITLAVLGVALEYFILRRGALWISVLADFAVSWIIVYYASNFQWYASVTWYGALLTSLLLGIVEYFTHRYLLASHKAHSEPI
ncbi:DUF2512 family protein [Fictibacillus terranigra]|uniref:DUF2512 family protein n=1 Tax=Fictibacillus terranigra TaxID=3058424 RepID=A0ABT8E9D9_9BACL|nr:DUF2512 family protein [Fictibacillus sp. CENA-BCM004]MDN4074504.1 DUF2512 family protein [Fictibacillus sp. CENA-BCM004]